VARCRSSVGSFSATADCCPRSPLTIIGSGLGIAVAQYPAQGPADHHPRSDDWRCRFLAAEIRTWDGPVKMASMSPDSFCWAIGKSMWFGRSSFCAGHLYMREGAVTNRVEGRNEFEHQGPVAYGRLCPTALGSVPPSASTQQQSDTQPRPVPHPSPLQECGSVQTWLIWSRKQGSCKIPYRGPDDLANQHQSSVKGESLVFADGFQSSNVHRRTCRERGSRGCRG